MFISYAANRACYNGSLPEPIRLTSPMNRDFYRNASFASDVSKRFSNGRKKRERAIICPVAV